MLKTAISKPGVSFICYLLYEPNRCAPCIHGFGGILKKLMDCYFIGTIKVKHLCCAPVILFHSS